MKLYPGKNIQKNIAYGKKKLNLTLRISNGQTKTPVFIESIKKCITH